VVNTGGEKVFVEEVEGALKSDPDVFDAVVVGVPDERWGQRVTALVHLAEGSAATEDELLGRVRHHLAGYKVPKQLILVDAVRRSPAGKADYRWAAEVAAGGG
jgi:acyl-CoA synthetase (AMP-forming)/AMP-acid ligase II